MSGPTQLVEKSIIELLLKHLNNDAIGQLLNKAPLKQRLNILPAGASNVVRNKAIQNLTVSKNLKYVISTFESGQLNGFVQIDFETITKPISLEQLKLQLSETEGKALGFLIQLISKDKMVAAVQLFNADTVEVNQLSEFIDSSDFSDFKLQRLQESESDAVDPDLVDMKTQIKKLQNENQRLQKKMEREASKVERDFKNKSAKLKVEHLDEINKLNEMHASEVANLKTDLSKAQRDLASRILKNEKLERSIKDLESVLKELRNLNRPAVLVVGNLPENSILDVQKYRILTTSIVDSNLDDLVENSAELIKAYLQSEYVSTGEYMAIKKRYPDLAIEYISRDYMKKGN